MDVEGTLKNLEDQLPEMTRSARRLIECKAQDPHDPQTEDGVETFDTRIEAFNRSFPVNAKCDCPVCSAERSVMTNSGYSFVMDGLDAVPTCQRLLARDIEFARVIVEEIYQPFLKDLSVVVRVDFIPPTGNVVNGDTLRSGPARMRRPGLDQNTRTVQVRFALPHDYTDETAAALLYVAVHELGIHALQQWGLSSAPMGELRCPTFSEGLVEAAVFSGLDQILMEESSELVPSDIYQAPVRERRRLHADTSSVDGGNVHNPQDIAKGHELFKLLRRFAEAAISNHSTAPKLLEQVNMKTRPIRRLCAVRNGESWARRLVIALNLANLNEDEREDTFWWLFEKLNNDFRDADRRFATYDQAPPGEFGKFINILNSLSRNPFNERKVSQLKKVVHDHRHGVA
ncbi:MAG: hypothetical protein AAGE03_07165 [Pseudomonadota bacterium]